MQLDRIGTAAVTTASKSQAASATSSPSAATTTGSAAQAQPLSGGRRTVSPGIFDEAETDSHIFPPDFAELVANKTHEVATALTNAFEGAHISTAEPMILSFDGSDTIRVADSRNERVMELSKNTPALAKQLKDAAALNTLLALNMAMRHFNDAKKGAKTDQQRQAAEANYTADTMAISARRNTMVLQNGELLSPAVAYMNVRTGNA